MPSLNTGASGTQPLDVPDGDSSAQAARQHNATQHQMCLFCMNGTPFVNLFVQLSCGPGKVPQTLKILVGGIQNLRGRGSGVEFLVLSHGGGRQVGAANPKRLVVHQHKFFVLHLVFLHIADFDPKTSEMFGKINQRTFQAQ